MGGKRRYICLDGDYFPIETNLFSINNRAFKYGDAIFETMYVSKRQILLFNEHIERLFFSMKQLKMEADISFNSDYISKKIISLLNANKLFIGARVRITVYRDSKGFYTPQTNNISFVIEADELLNTKYEFNTKGLHIDTYTQIKKSNNYFSGLKTTNSLLYVMAGIYKKEKKVDECVLFNEDNFVIESISSNIFIVKNNIIFTPSLDQGCINGIMRNTIIDVALSYGYSVVDEAQLKINDLRTADELFLTNAVFGVQWIMAFGGIRYYNKVSKILINELNKTSSLI